MQIIMKIGQKFKIGEIPLPQVPLHEIIGPFIINYYY